MAEYFSPTHKDRADGDKTREKALSEGIKEVTKTGLAAILPSLPVDLGQKNSGPSIPHPEQAPGQRRIAIKKTDRCICRHVH
jgi:hypothetical protein